MRCPNCKIREVSWGTFCNHCKREEQDREKRVQKEREEKRQQDQDRRDAERRHQELLRAAKEAGQREQEQDDLRRAEDRRIQRERAIETDERDAEARRMALEAEIRSRRVESNRQILQLAFDAAENPEVAKRRIAAFTRSPFLTDDFGYVWEQFLAQPDLPRLYAEHLVERMNPASCSIAEFEAGLDALWAPPFGTAERWSQAETSNALPPFTEPELFTRVCSHPTVVAQEELVSVVEANRAKWKAKYDAQLAKHLEAEELVRLQAAIENELQQQTAKESAERLRQSHLALVEVERLARERGEIKLYGVAWWCGWLWAPFMASLLIGVLLGKSGILETQSSDEQLTSWSFGVGTPIGIASYAFWTWRKIKLKRRYEGGHGEPRPRL